MGDLALDTALDPLDDDAGDTDDDGEVGSGGRGGAGPAGVQRYRGKLSADWELWGPNGGYVAALALRAAGSATRRDRPASIAAHLLGVASFDTVDLEVTTLRTARFATSARVSLTQGGRPILEAMVWGVDDGGIALTHHEAPPPPVPPHDELPTREERMASLPPDDPGPPHLSFFDNLDQRALDWQDSWPPAGPLDPVGRWWMRFRPTPRFDDPWVDACRFLIPIDTMGWPAGNLPHAYREPLPVVAVTVDLSVRFHHATEDEWLLVEAVSPVAAGGLMAATGHVWDRAGTLLASGGQTMLCRPAPRPR